MVDLCIMGSIINALKDKCCCCGKKEEETDGTNIRITVPLTCCVSVGEDATYSTSVTRADTRRSRRQLSNIIPTEESPPPPHHTHTEVHVTVDQDDNSN